MKNKAVKFFTRFQKFEIVSISKQINKMDVSGVISILHRCFQALTLDTIKAQVSLHENSITSVEEVKPVPKKVIRRVIKKKAEPAPRRCDARIYGEALLLEGTKAPNGSPYKVYKPKQCEKNSTVSIAVDGDDEGELYLCTVCENRYKIRQQNPAMWHGFFDGDVPETSHFVNGSWHRKRLEKIEKAPSLNE
jgi:hypothetical protein